MESQNEKTNLDQMREIIEYEKEKRNYDVSQPWEPMNAPSPYGRVFGSLFVRLVLIAIAALVISFVGAKNTGGEFTLFGLLTL